MIDWDPASNAMGWQWSAGSGPDATPYFRVFNPNTQREKYDPNFQYCTKWIDELQADGIYNLKEIVDVKKSRLEAIDRYKKCV